MPEIPYWKKLWVLFYTFAKIAALVVGGGYAILPVVEETFSKKNNWLTSEELLDMMGLVQTVPGIIACNSAIYVGRRVAGFGGILAAAFGVCLPSVLIILIIAMFFPDLDPKNPWLLGAFRGVRACVTALVTMTAFRMAKKSPEIMVRICDRVDRTGPGAAAESGTGVCDPGRDADRRALCLVSAR